VYECPEYRQFNEVRPSEDGCGPELRPASIYGVELEFSTVVSETPRFLGKRDDVKRGSMT
jgi:hypothetical protein